MGMMIDPRMEALRFLLRQHAMATPQQQPEAPPSPTWFDFQRWLQQGAGQPPAPPTDPAPPAPGNPFDSSHTPKSDPVTDPAPDPALTDPSASGTRQPPQPAPMDPADPGAKRPGEGVMGQGLGAANPMAPAPRTRTQGEPRYGR